AITLGAEQTIAHMRRAARSLRDFSGGSTPGTFHFENLIRRRGDDGADRGIQDLLDKPFSVRGAPCGRSGHQQFADRRRRCASAMAGKAMRVLRAFGGGEKEESRWRGEVPAARLSSSRVDWLAQPIC